MQAKLLWLVRRDVTHSNLNPRLSGGWLTRGVNVGKSIIWVSGNSIFTHPWKKKQNKHTHKQLRHFTQHIDLVLLWRFWEMEKKTIVWKPTPGHLTAYCKHQTSQLLFQKKKNISDSNELELIRPQKDTCNLSHRLTFKGILVYLYDTNPTNAFLRSKSWRINQPD